MMIATLPNAHEEFARIYIETHGSNRANHQSILRHRDQKHNKHLPLHPHHQTTSTFLTNTAQAPTATTD